MIYTFQVWGQKENQIKKTSELQDKALRIINFKPINHPVLELYKNNKILKLQDYIKLLICMFVKDVLAGNHIPVFEKVFMKTSETCRHRTRHSSKNTVVLPQPKTENYGKTSVFYQAALTWNNMKNAFPIDLVEENNSKVKESIINHFLNTYNE